MNLRLIPALLATAALAACQREAEAPPPAEPVSAAVPAPTGDPAETAARADVDQPTGQSFVGRWAATPALCADGAWDFTAEGVSTAGEVSCRWTRVEPVRTGFRVGARCTAEGTQTDSAVDLALTDTAEPRRMTVTGGPWDGPITLTRCQ